LARILQRAGLYVGTSLNESNDAIEFGEYSDRWINRYLRFRDVGLPPDLENDMLGDLHAVLARHLVPLGPTTRRWGWKEPRSIYLLPFFTRHFPELRFLHVVRDGRDMALSSNQNQLRMHGAAVGVTEGGRSVPEQSIALWSWINLETARYGENVLGKRYFRIRFEDFCCEPVAVTAAMFGFFGLDADPEMAIEEVSPPPTVGRWRDADRALVDRLHLIGGEALNELGY
jgi:Sulfotransferase family